MSEFHPYLIQKINVMTSDSEKLDLKLKNNVLKFLLAFNIFESEFFREPKWDDQGDNNKSEYKHVWQRINAIQDLCNANNYSLVLLKKFQEHFAEVYIENTAWTDRFRSLEKNSFNKNGYDEEKMKHMYIFLTNPLENGKRYAIKNALTLSYTFRNNLFHGQKDIRDLKEYEDDFEEIADFLISLMKYLNEINADEF